MRVPILNSAQMAALQRGEPLRMLEPMPEEDGLTGDIDPDASELDNDSIRKFGDEQSESGESWTRNSSARKDDCVKEPGNTKTFMPYPSIGGFHTKEITPTGRCEKNTTKRYNIANTHLARPQLAIALNGIDIDRNRGNPRIICTEGNVGEKCMDVYISTWSDTCLYWASCTWLEMLNDHPGFQQGTYSISSQRPWSEPTSKNNMRIKFARKFNSPPKVVCFLKGFDLDKRRNWRVKTYATEVTAEGFRIHIDAWGDTILHGGEATWVAYESSLPGIVSGTASTTEQRPPEEPQKYNTGFVEFEEGIFKTKPRAFVGIQSFDIGRQHHMRLKVQPYKVNRLGMAWKADCWLDNNLYSAGISYIVMEDGRGV